MKRRILFFILFAGMVTPVMAGSFTSCGPGYVLVESRKNIDDIPVAECQKLWCRDLENGKMMGKEDRANSGYQMSADVVQLCDAAKPTPKCIECWGERRWCNGEPRGDWNPEYGAYVRGGDLTYKSYQKGSCFAWRLEKPKCEAGLSAILVDGKWECVPPSAPVGASRGSAIRRTGTIRAIKR